MEVLTFPLRFYSVRPLQRHQDSRTGAHEQTVQRANIRSRPVGNVQHRRAEQRPIPAGPDNGRTRLQYPVCGK